MARNYPHELLEVRCAQATTDASMVSAEPSVRSFELSKIFLCRYEQKLEQKLADLEDTLQAQLTRTVSTVSLIQDAVLTFPISALK